MKAINVGMKCARCNMETCECVKMHDFETGQEVCYDTNVISVDVEKEAADTISKLVKLCEEYRNGWIISTIGLLSVCVFALIKLIFF